MALVNVYDFDRTLVPYDCTIVFFRECMRKYPHVFRAAAPCLLRLPLFLNGVEGKTRFKEVFYRFVRRVPDITDEVERFWEAHYDDVSDWYMQQKRPDDIIISASAEFMLAPIARMLGVRLIGSRVDKYSGETTGLNNGGKEKVRRLREAYPEVEIDNFYSDSGVDLPLALEARNAFAIRDEQVFPWPRDEKGRLKRRL